MSCRKREMDAPLLFIFPLTMAMAQPPPGSVFARAGARPTLSGIGRAPSGAGSGTDTILGIVTVAPSACGTVSKCLMNECTECSSTASNASRTAPPIAFSSDSRFWAGEALPCARRWFAAPEHQRL
jgi:hypothetical protein